MTTYELYTKVYNLLKECQESEVYINYESFINYVESINEEFGEGYPDHRPLRMKYVYYGSVASYMLTIDFMIRNELIIVEMYRIVCQLETISKSNFTIKELTGESMATKQREV